MNIRDSVVSKVSSFPTLPTIANKLLALIGDSGSNLAEIEKVIQYDPALTANVLKAANSSYLGFTEPVTSVAEASRRIGLKWLFQIALSSLIYSNLRNPAKGYDLSAHDLSGHSIAVAVLSENLSKALNLSDWGSIFTAGLIHDIGKIASQEWVSECFEDIQGMVEREKASFEEAERTVLGVDHAEVGAMIAENWRFPPLIIEVIRWHHNPEKAEKALPALDVVHVADALCLMQGIGIGRDGLQYRCSEKSLSRLNLTGETVEAAISQVLVSVEDIQSMFSGLETPCQVRR